ncbi:MAG: molecular chaperone DnaJ [Actinomycetota bacterium]|nr:molecular chaperone DnaJ [Actinomycetota bacterium]
MADTDFYALLGVPRTASEDEIKRAYRKLARELHPDSNPGNKEAEERFKQVSVAYETLRDPERRRRYDAFGIDGLRGAAGGDPFAGAGFGGLGDLFDAFFGGTSPFGGGGGRGGRRSGPVRGADAEIRVTLDFEEAVFGTQKEVSVRVATACETCSATGAAPGTTPVPCPQCAGTGEVRTVRQSLLGQMVTSRPCPRCNGTGEHIASPCPSCHGDGTVLDERKLLVEVPAGVDTGMTLRLQGRGMAGPRGGPTGDLYVHLEVRPDPRFERRGDDLVHELHVAATQAALGAHLELETLDGPEPLAIPPGTQTGRVFRLRGRGVPHVSGRDRGRGDLLVQVVVDTPTSLSPTEERLLRELAAARGESVDPPDTGLFSKIRSAFK